MPSPDTNTLDFYSERGDWKSLISTAHDILQLDPENYQAHHHLIYAYISLETPQKADTHLETILRTNPEAFNTLLAAVILRFQQGKHRQAKSFVQQGLTHYPENSSFYYYDAAIAARKLKTRFAKQQIAKAKELDPEDPEIADLYLRIHGIDESSAKDALARIEEYHIALRKEPENAALHQGIGDVYMDDLHRAKEAEQHYREAVRLNPNDKDYRQTLFQAVAMQSTLYGLISLPSRAFSFLKYVAMGLTIQPWRLIFLVLGFKLIGAFFVWLTFATVLFWPLSKIYEHLLVSEIKSLENVSNRKLQSWFYFQSKPIWFRFSLFLLLATLVYSGLFLATGSSLKIGFISLGIFTGLHVPFLLAARFFRKLRYESAQKRSKSATAGSR